MDEKLINRKLDMIESDIDSLKKMIINIESTNPKKVVRLKGLLKGIEVTEDDIREAKGSLFKMGG